MTSVWEILAEETYGKLWHPHRDKGSSIEMTFHKIYPEKRNEFLWKREENWSFIFKDQGTRMACSWLSRTSAETHLASSSFRLVTAAVCISAAPSAARARLASTTVRTNDDDDENVPLLRALELELELLLLALIRSLSSSAQSIKWPPPPRCHSR